MWSNLREYYRSILISNQDTESSEYLLNSVHQQKQIYKRSWLLKKLCVAWNNFLHPDQDTITPRELLLQKLDEKKWDKSQ